MPECLEDFIGEDNPFRVVDAFVEELDKSRVPARVRRRLKVTIAAVRRPVLFLDIDDVLCLGKPYGGGHLLMPASERPVDLFELLWHAPAKEAMGQLMAEKEPWVVLTTTWLRHLDLEGFRGLFQHTGLGCVANALHPSGEAPTLAGQTRLAAVERWLKTHHSGEPFAVLDDPVSGTGLRGSRLDRQRRVVLCEVDVGLNAGHLTALRRALSAS